MYFLLGFQDRYALITQLAEYRLDKAEVEGSNPSEGTVPEAE